jgi:hypothetical protein
MRAWTRSRVVVDWFCWWPNRNHCGHPYIGYLRTSYAVKGNPVFASPALLHSLIFVGLAMGALAMLPIVPKQARS